MIIPAFMVMETRHPHIQLRPPANQVGFQSHSHQSIN